MAIKMSKSWKVLEQAADGTGCGTVVASFKESQGGEAAAQDKADELAAQNAPMRFYVAEVTSGVYQNRRGELGRRDYTNE
jgi:hypothetical protein